MADIIRDHTDLEKDAKPGKLPMGNLDQVGAKLDHAIVEKEKELSFLTNQANELREEIARMKDTRDKLAVLIWAERDSKIVEKLPKKP